MSPPDPKARRYTRAVKDRLVAASEGREGRYLVEGKKTIADALAGGRTVREIWIADDLPADDSDALTAAAAAREVPVGVAPRKDLDRASDTVTPQGALAIVDDPSLPAADVLARATGPILLLDRMQDPGNVGAVFRVAAGLGASGVLVSDDGADPMRCKALRASAGTALHVPFARAPLRSLLDACHAADVPVWLLDSSGKDIWKLADRPRVVALAIGSEGEGASPPLAGNASLHVSIPMAPGVDSLNAAVSAGIALAVVARLPIAGSLAPTVTTPAPGPRAARR